MVNELKVEQVEEARAVSSLLLYPRVMPLEGKFVGRDRDCFDISGGKEHGLGRFMF